MLADRYILPSVDVLSTGGEPAFHRTFPCLRYTSTALRMYVLLGISPRTLSILCNIDLGRVIPTFSVLSTAIVPFIPVLYIALPRIKHIDDCPAFYYLHSFRKQIPKVLVHIRTTFITYINISYKM
jgi:hypothetical protein